jgi:hypothetical protein
VHLPNVPDDDVARLEPMAARDSLSGNAVAGA